MPPDPEPSRKSHGTARRRIRLRRRKRLPIVRLGGEQATKPLQGPVMVKMLQKMKFQYYFTLKKLKEYYHTMVKEFVEAGASLDSLQQRIVMESSFTVPIKGVAVASFPSAAGVPAPAANRRR